MTPLISIVINLLIVAWIYAASTQAYRFRNGRRWQKRSDKIPYEIVEKRLNMVKLQDKEDFAWRQSFWISMRVMEASWEEVPGTPEALLRLAATVFLFATVIMLFVGIFTGSYWGIAY